MLARILLLSAFSGVLIFAAASSSPAAPFEGKWDIDKKKTQAKGFPEDLRCEIRNDPAGLMIRSQYREPKNAIYPLLWVGIMTYELPLSIDGTEKTNQIGPWTHVSKTSIDGRKMTTDWRATMENGSVEGQWIRTVSDDGREMQLQIIAKASDGRRMDQTLVFKRK